MTSYTALYNLVDSHIDQFSNDSITLYKITGVTPDRYKQGTVTYDSGTAIVCVARVVTDDDVLTAIGKLNEDLLQFTISVKELNEKYPSISDNNDLVKYNDAIKFEDKPYSIEKVEYQGRVYGGGMTVISVYAVEDPDKVLP